MHEKDSAGLDKLRTDAAYKRRQYPVARNAFLAVAALTEGEPITDSRSFVEEVTGVEYYYSQIALRDLQRANTLFCTDDPETNGARLKINPEDADALEIGMSSEIELFDGQSVERNVLADVVRKKIISDRTSRDLTESIRALHHDR